MAMACSLGSLEGPENPRPQSVKNTLTPLTLAHTWRQTCCCSCLRLLAAT